MQSAPGVMPAPAPGAAVPPPAFNEPPALLTLRLYSRGAAGRWRLEDMICDSFRRRHGAAVCEFYPDLLGFEGGNVLHAAVGLREGTGRAFFAEHYLDAPAELLIGRELGLAVTRAEIVELGHMALTAPGQSRWLIAAVTAYLYNAGYRCALFTAIPPLYNAFRRMGLGPLHLAAADPARLPGGGKEWGDHCSLGPRVCAGNIVRGFRTLRHAVQRGTPRLQTLWQSACLRAAFHHRDKSGGLLSQRR